MVKHTSPVKPRQPGLSDGQNRASRNVLGGTDAAAILGVSRFRGPWDVYAEKAGLAGPRGPMSENALWGLLLEPAIIGEYERRTGLTVRPGRRLVRHRVRRWQGGHLDGTAGQGRRQDRALEIKTRASDQDWGDPGTDEVPADVKIQAEHYMAVTELPRVDIPVLFRGSRLAIYTIMADPGILRDLTDEEQEWWDRHVVRGEEPEWDGSPGATGYLRRQYPVDSGDLMVALPHQYGILKDLTDARRRKAFYEQQEKALGQQIQAAMGDAGTLLAPGLKIRWLRPGSHQSVDWERYAGSLEGLVEQMALGMVPITEDPLATRTALRGLYTSNKPGTPQFRVYEQKENQLT